MSVTRLPSLAARYVVWTLLTVALVWCGLLLRDWTFASTAPIRFRGDVENAVVIGRRVMINASRAAAASTQPSTAPVGRSYMNLASPTWPQLWSSFVGTYDAEYERAATRGEVADASFRLDYPPGRLLIVSAWAKHTTDRRGFAFGYSDAMVEPMLGVNSAHEFLAAAGAAALVWEALRRAGASPLKAEALGIASGALLWFNPALILDAHGWPQWDAWVLPYTLWASFFALRNRWVATGALLAVGSLFKGQVLLIAPLFALWPLFQFRFGAVARLVIGMAAAAGLAGVPWMILRGQPFAMPWAAIAVSLSFAIAFWPKSRVMRGEWIGLGVLLFGWLALACLGVGPIALPAAVVACGAYCTLAAMMKRGRLPLALAATATILFTGGLIFDGSFAWLRVGFQTDRYPVLHLGNTVNLAAILERFYGYGSDSPIAIGDTNVSLRILLRWSAYAAVAVASLGIALRDRARDANVLVGFAAAWTALYALMPQMHERYLVWGAAMSSLLVARSIGGLFVCLAISALQSAMLLCSMIEAHGMTNDPTFGPIHFVVRGMSPAAGWATLTLAGLLLVWSFRRSPVGSRTAHGPDRAGNAPTFIGRGDTSPVHA